MLSPHISTVFKIAQHECVRCGLQGQSAKSLIRISAFAHYSTENQVSLESCGVIEACLQYSGPKDAEIDLIPSEALTAIPIACYSVDSFRTTCRAVCVVWPADTRPPVSAAPIKAKSK